jgi:hypothetical protein
VVIGVAVGVRVHLCEGINERRAHVLDDGAGARAAKLEDALHHADLCGGCVHTAERAPVVDHHAGAQHVAASVDRARHQGHLQQRRQLLQVFYRCAGMHLQGLE